MMLAPLCLPVIIIVVALAQSVSNLVQEPAASFEPIEQVIRGIRDQHRNARQIYERRFHVLSERVSDALNALSGFDEAAVRRLWRICRSVTRQYWREVRANFDEQTERAERAARRAVQEFFGALPAPVRQHTLVQYFHETMLLTFHEYESLALAYLKARETDEFRDLGQCFRQVYVVRENAAGGGEYGDLRRYRQALWNVYETASALMFRTALNYWDMNELLIENAARRVRGLARSVHDIRSLNVAETKAE